jgi:hypothetical protein
MNSAAPIGFVVEQWQVPLAQLLPTATTTFDLLNSTTLATSFKCYPTPSGACDTDGNPDASLVEFGFQYDTRGGVSTSAAQQLGPPWLDWDEIRNEIAVRGRPFIFEWSYEGGGDHYLVVNGYYTTAVKRLKKLRIWDPMPITSSNASQLQSAVPAGGAAKLISYEAYSAIAADNYYDMGLVVSHVRDVFNVRMSPIPKPMAPSGLQVTGGTAVAPQAAAATGATPAPPMGLRLARANYVSRPFAFATVRQLAEAGSDNSAAVATLPALGYGFPIVALRLDELRSANRGSIGRLLRRKTNVVLYPVESGGEVRDSLLMVARNNVWTENGYANTTVTRRLVEIRDRIATTDRKKSRYYLLSVPALNAFFVARGRHGGATLIPASDDPSISIGRSGGTLRAGQPYKARDLIPRLIEAAARYPAGSPAPALVSD